MIEILKRTHGRAFVLFTSYATMRAVQAIAEMALDYPIFAQGTAPRSQLLNQFRATPHAVLFATSSFWQGVDVVGEALSCVIIDKLPFASPGDPITAARIDAIRARGGDPFGEYQVPLAILALQQGLGRLIRHRRDRGVLAVLDPRLRTMGYGRRFIASLPPAPIVHDLEASRRSSNRRHGGDEKRDVRPPLRSEVEVQPDVDPPHALHRRRLAEQRRRQRAAVADVVRAVGQVLRVDDDAHAEARQRVGLTASAR